MTPCEMNYINGETKVVVLLFCNEVKTEKFFFIKLETMNCEKL